MTTIFSNTSNFNSKHKPPGNGNNQYNHPPRDNGKDNDSNTNLYSPIPTNEIPLREVTNLMKIYSDKEKKFGGELYDILDAKLQIFQDCCNKVGIQRYQYHHAFSVMLKGRAATFYYDHIAGKRHDFDIML